jgi:hypothetical protein
MPIVTVELPSGNITKVGVDPETTLRQVALMLELDPGSLVFFIGRYEGVLGTLIGPSSDAKFGNFNTNSIAILDKNAVREEDLARFTKACEQGY